VLHDDVTKHPPRKRRPIQRLSIALTEGEYEQLARVAKSTERSMSWLGRYALRKLLRDYETQQLALPLELGENL